MQPAPDAGPGPDQEPAVGGRLRYPEARRQGPPGTAGHQDVDVRGEQRLIGRVRRPAALRPHLRRWDQRLRDLPQPVRNNPTPRTPPHGRTNEPAPHRTRSKKPPVFVADAEQVAIDPDAEAGAGRALHYPGERRARAAYLCAVPARASRARNVRPLLLSLAGGRPGRLGAAPTRGVLRCGVTGGVPCAETTTRGPPVERRTPCGRRCGVRKPRREELPPGPRPRRPGAGGGWPVRRGPARWRRRSRYRR